MHETTGDLGRKITIHTGRSQQATRKRVHIEDELVRNDEVMEQFYQWYHHRCMDFKSLSRIFVIHVTDSATASSSLYSFITMNSKEVML